MISSVNKFLFVHVPKTAGRSIKNGLSLQGVDELGLVLLGHCSINKTFDLQGEVDVAHITQRSNRLKKLNESRKKRGKKGNPWSLKREYYDDLVLNSKNRILKLKGLKIDDFFKFSVTRNPWDRVVSIFLQQERLKHRLIKRKHPWLANRKSIDFETYCELAFEQEDNSSLSWMKDKNNEIKMDFIIKFESLEKDWISICNSINIDHQPLPCVGKAPNTKFDTYQKYYNSNTKKIIKNKFEEDIEYFKYTF
jgi:hypothetical protein